MFITFTYLQDNEECEKTINIELIQSVDDKFVNTRELDSVKHFGIVSSDYSGNTPEYFENEWVFHKYRYKGSKQDILNLLG